LADAYNEQLERSVTLFGNSKITTDEQHLGSTYVSQKNLLIQPEAVELSNFPILQMVTFNQIYNYDRSRIG